MPHCALRLDCLRLLDVPARQLTDNLQTSVNLLNRGLILLLTQPLLDGPLKRMEDFSPLPSLGLYAFLLAGLIHIVAYQLLVLRDCPVKPMLLSKDLLPVSLSR
jgi:hypothetical protein